MVHITGNKILLTKEEVGSILIPYDGNKPEIILGDGEGKSRFYTIDLSDRFIHEKKATNEIDVKEL